MSSNKNNSQNHEAEALFASVNKNYPLWCYTFEQDLRNYYQPDPPLEFYVDVNDTNLDCSHPDYNCRPHCPPHSHPHPLEYYHRNFCPNFHDHPHYLNHRHVKAQINARHQTRPFAPHLVDWLSLEHEKEEDTDAAEAGRKRRRNKMGIGAQVYKTGMYCANGNVMVKFTVFG